MTKETTQTLEKTIRRLGNSLTVETSCPVSSSVTEDPKTYVRSYEVHCDKKPNKEVLRVQILKDAMGLESLFNEEGRFSDSGSLDVRAIQIGKMSAVRKKFLDSTDYRVHVTIEGTAKQIGKAEQALQTRGSIIRAYSGDLDKGIGEEKASLLSRAKNAYAGVICGFLSPVYIVGTSVLTLAGTIKIAQSLFPRAYMGDATLIGTMVGLATGLAAGLIAHEHVEERKNQNEK